MNRCWVRMLNLYIKKKDTSAGKMLKGRKKTVLHALLYVLNCRNEITNHHDMQI